MSEQYAKVETRLLAHPKFLGLSLGARGLWLTGLLYAKAQLTGGFLPASFVAYGLGCASNDPPIAELVERGLWEASEEGWQMHDYGDHQSDPDFADMGRRSAARRSTDYTALARRRWMRTDANGHANADANGCERFVDSACERDAKETETGNRDSVSPSGETLSSPALRSFTDLWNAHRGRLPRMLKPPAREPARGLVLACWERFDGDESEIAAAIERCAQDRHYLEGGFGYEAFCRHADRFTVDRPVLLAQRPRSAAQADYERRQAFLAGEIP